MSARRNRILIRKIRRRTRMMRLSVALVLMVSLVTYFGIIEYRKYEQSHKNIAAITTPAGEIPAVETIADIIGKTHEIIKPETDFSAKDFIVQIENLSFSVAKTLPRKIDFDVLLKGSSYSIRASRYAYDTDEVKGWMKGTIEYHGPKIAFLTFDDGPGKYTPAILDILKEKKTPATFFVLGRSLAKVSDQSIMLRYIRDGHAIANHSYSHEYSYMYPERVANAGRILEEYQKSLNLMKEILGDNFNTTVFRYPGGSGSWNNIEASKSSLAELGVKYIDWNSMSGDSEPKSRRPVGNEALSDYVLATLRNNRHPEVAIVLMHDSLEVTPGYISLVIDKLRAEGYTFGILK